jgi:hypothetical protein
LRYQVRHPHSIFSKRRKKGITCGDCLHLQTSFSKENSLFTHRYKAGDFQLKSDFQVELIPYELAWTLLYLELLKNLQKVNRDFQYPYDLLKRAIVAQKQTWYPFKKKRITSIHNL